MKGLILIFSLCAALLLAACGSSSNNSSSGGGGGGSTGSVTGIAACDEYIAKLDKCMNNPNIPESVRTNWKQSLEKGRESWKQGAATAEGRAAAEAQCKAAMDTAKAFLDTCK
jgi:hypothetical protein